RNAVAIIDAVSGATMGSLALGASALAIATNSSGSRLYLPQLETDSIVVVDTATNATSVLAIGRRPSLLNVSPDGTRIYVRVDAGLQVLDASTLAELATINLP